MQFAPQHPVPVFPLPGFVMFPHTVVPLHIFELRYRTMVRDALSRGRVIMLALLKPGWEEEYYDAPEFHALGCLVRFEEVEWLPNDCYNLKVKGVSRVNVQRVTSEYPYRAARLTLAPEAPYDEDDPLTQMEKQALHETLKRWVEVLSQKSESPAEVPEPESYEALVNTLCTVAEATPEEKLGWLKLDNVLERGRIVRDLTERRIAARRRASERGEGGDN